MPPLIPDGREERVNRNQLGDAERAKHGVRPDRDGRLVDARSGRVVARVQALLGFVLGRVNVDAPEALGAVDAALGHGLVDGLVKGGGGGLERVREGGC